MDRTGRERAGRDDLLENYPYRQVLGGTLSITHQE